MSKQKIDIKREIYENSNDNIVPLHLGKVIEYNQKIYSDLVITGRAIPLIFDGLKPVHRRLFYTFKTGQGLINKFIKSGRLVGDTLGKFHPHGDMAIYGSLVDQVQPFKNRFPLLNGQGNWGNIQGDSCAAQRYTEIRLPNSSADMLFQNIDKDDVITWDKNYDDTLLEPNVLPVDFPIAILNGTSGIAYAHITTNIPSYNIVELGKFYIYLLENKFYSKDFKIEEHKKKILKIIQGVDLPTGTNIYFDPGDKSIQEDMIFKSEFTFRMRANYEINEKENTITFTNIPINVTTDLIVEQIKNAGLSYKEESNGKKIPKNENKILNIKENAYVKSISSFDDVDYKNDAEIVLYFKKGCNLNIELIKVFKYTDLDKSFSARMMFVDENTCPGLYSLYEQSCKFLNFKLHNFYKAYQYDIKKMEDKLHLLNGLTIIQKNLDLFIKIVRNSKDENLYEKIKESFNLDDIQIEYLLSIQIKRLSQTSIEKIEEEKKELNIQLNLLNDKISTKDNLYRDILNYYVDLLKKPHINNKINKRISNIIESTKNISKEDMIEDKEIIVMYMEDDTIAFVEKSGFKLKNRGTKTTNIKINNSFELKLMISESCKLKDDLLLISNFGKVFKMKAYEIGEQFRFIGNIIKLDKEEKIVNIIKYNLEDNYYCISTKFGKIKGVNKELFNNTTSNRTIKSINLDKGDVVISFISYNKIKNEKVILLTSDGRVIKYSTEEINIMQGGNTKGTKSLTLNEKEYVMKTFIFEETEKTSLLGVSNLGRAKKTFTNNISDKKRAQSPIQFFNNDKTNGMIVSGEIFENEDNEVLMLLSEKADISLIKIKSFNKVSRNAKGSVKLLNLEKNEKIIMTKKILTEHLSETQSQILQEINIENV